MPWIKYKYKHGYISPHKIIVQSHRVHKNTHKDDTDITIRTPQTAKHFSIDDCVDIQITIKECDYLFVGCCPTLATVCSDRVFECRLLYFYQSDMHEYHTRRCDVASMVALMVSFVLLRTLQIQHIDRNT